MKGTCTVLRGEGNGNIPDLPDKLEQCYSRAVRLGQRDVVDVHWMIAVDTIDANIHGLVLSKVSGVDLAVDRKELDFKAIAEEFDGESVLSEDIDYEAFAGEMLSRGTSRTQAYATETA